MYEMIKTDECGIIRITSEKFGTYDFIIDLEDIDRCKNLSWHIFRGGDYKNYFYARHAKEDKKNNIKESFFLHRFLLGANKEYVVDHINGNTLDNRKVNLRICTFEMNCKNRKRRNINNTSGHKGVTQVEIYGKMKWMAYIHKKEGYKNLGYYDLFEDAVEARKQGEIDYNGAYLPQKDWAEFEHKPIDLK